MTFEFKPASPEELAARGVKPPAEAEKAPAEQPVQTAEKRAPARRAKEPKK